MRQRVGGDESLACSVGGIGLDAGITENGYGEVMMNESGNQELETVGDSVTDPELERMLNDAFDVGPVPRSLLVRIDRAVTSEWGVSPKLVESPFAVWTGRWTAFAARSARWRRSLPIAGAVALLVVLGVVFSGNSRSYAWSAVLEALERHGVIEMTENGETSWLALADGVSGERTSDSVRLIDMWEQVLLERRSGSGTVERHRLGRVDRNSLVLGFLSRHSERAGFDPATQSARVLSEEWETVQNGAAEEISLRVRFQCEESAELVNVALTLNPETCLPTSVDLGSVEPQVAKLSLTKVTAASLRAEQFPPGLTVVDIGTDGQPLLNVAARSNSSAVSEKPVVAADPETQLAANGPIEPVAVPEVSADPPLFGAPSKWRAVEPVLLSEEEVVKQANATLSKLWEDNKVIAARAADESELLRRVFLDLAGRTPSVTEVRHWLNDQSPNRYETTVDRLLNSPDFASHTATVWRSFLIPEGVDLTAFGGVQEFDQWLADRLGNDRSYDETVRSLLLAEGRLSRSGPLLFYSALKLDPDQLAARTSRVFLGMRLECAQCHDHPFEPWPQQAFWGFAAFFARISRPQAQLETVSTIMRVRDVDRGEVMLPNTQTVVAPGFLDGAAIAETEREDARRQQLARWLTSARNPYFARATVNRVWGQLFGKGIVDPIDDFGTQHKPTSPELLDLLAGHFINTGFDLKELFRTVAMTRAYQLSSGDETVDENRTKLFAQMNVKTLTAEQVFDCIAVATLLDAPVTGPDGVNVVERFANASRVEFVTQFRTPTGRTTEYLGGIPQALTLMNGGLIAGATGLSTSGLLKSLEAPFFTNEQRVEVLYLATLSRKPRPTEWELLKGYIAENATGAELREGLADILWALLNSAEFTLNH